MQRARGVITKVDEDKRLVFGWASIIKDEVGKVLLDRQDDYIDSEDELEKAAYAYVLHSRDGGEMHVRKGVSTVVESVVFTKEKQAALGIPEGTMPVGWWVGFKVNDDRVWNEVKKGNYIGFSVHGTGQRSAGLLKDGEFTDVEKGSQDMDVCKMCGAKMHKGVCKDCGYVEKSDCGCGCGGKSEPVFVVPRRLLTTMSKAQNMKSGKVARVMREFESGELRSSSGEPVKSRRQALAIAMSEAGMSKGDCAGHPFRGNQHTGGKPGQGGCGSGSGGSKGGTKGGGKKSTGGKPSRSDRAAGGGKPDAKRSKEISESARSAARGNNSEVRLRTAQEVDEFMKAFHAEVTKMKAAGEKANDFNLCKVTVPGTNLFCGDNVGKPRVSMPQIGGKPVAGTDADKLPKNKDGEVDGTQAFKEHMESQGIKFRETRVKVKELKASQNELVGPKVAGMANNQSYNPAGKPIFVSSDGYVLDGHHRWAAVVARDTVDGVIGDLDMPVVQIDMPIRELLDFSEQWSEDFGIAPKAAKS